MSTRLTLAALLLTGCQALVGSGNVTSTTRDVSSFRRVSIASGITAAIATGSRSVTITADDNLQSVIETEIEGDTLMVRVRPGVLISSRRQLAADITNDFLEGARRLGWLPRHLGAHPGGHPAESRPRAESTIDASPVSSTLVSLEASGGSHITLAGAATDGTVVASGGSDVLLRELPLQTLHVDVSGGSTLAGRVASTLSGDVSGGSTVTIIGTPNSTVATSGGSHVTTGAQ